ncbi:MAG: prepilin peptidase, partial [Candidatus Hodarchaeales archaeon]
MSEPAINFLMVIIAVILLGIASYHDIRTRMVSDWIWICMIGSGSVLHILQLITTLNSPNETQ